MQKQVLQISQEDPHSCVTQSLAVSVLSHFSKNEARMEAMMPLFCYDNSKMMQFGLHQQSRPQAQSDAASPGRGSLHEYACHLGTREPAKYSEASTPALVPPFTGMMTTTYGPPAN